MILLKILSSVGAEIVACVFLDHQNLQMLPQKYLKIEFQTASERRGALTIVVVEMIDRCRAACCFLVTLTPLMSKKTERIITRNSMKYNFYHDNFKYSSTKPICLSCLFL